MYQVGENVEFDKNQCYCACSAEKDGIIELCIVSAVVWQRDVV